MSERSTCVCAKMGRVLVPFVISTRAFERPCSAFGALCFLTLSHLPQLCHRHTLLLGLLAYLCGMELADFAGPRRRWVDHLVEEDDLAGLTGDGQFGGVARAADAEEWAVPLVGAVALPVQVALIMAPRVLRVCRISLGNCLRLCLWLVATGSTDIATLQNLQVYLQHNMPPAYLAPCWVWQWLWLPVFVVKCQVHPDFVARVKKNAFLNLLSNAFMFGLRAGQPLHSPKCPLSRRLRFLASTVRLLDVGATVQEKIAGTKVVPDSLGN